MMNTKKVKQIILPNLPYAFLFWLFDKIGESYRISPGVDILRKAMNAVGNLGVVISRPMLSFAPFDLLIGLIGAVAVYGYITYKKRHAKKWRKDIEYGSARWGNSDDIAPYQDATPDNNIILTASESLTLNGRPANPKHARNKNVLIIGGSGSGKTRFFVKPNIMQLHSSYVVTDPKGQILVEVGRLLKRGAPMMKSKLGKDGKPLKDKSGNVINEVVRKNGKIVRQPYEIKVLNTIDFKKSMHYNPFAYIRSEKDILKFVTALIANTKGEDSKGGEDFWVKAETLLYCALVGLIHYESKTPEERNMNTLVELINSMEVHEEDESFQNAVDIVFERLEKGIPLLDVNDEPVLDDNGEKVYKKPPQPNHFAVRQYKKYRLAAGVIRFKGLLNQKYIKPRSQYACGTGERTPHDGYKPGKENLMELEYVQAGDYLLPTLKLSDPPDAPPIGRYGKMRRAFLKEHRPIEYSRLLLSEQLFPQLRTVDEIADERRKNGCPESVIIREIVCEL